MAGGRLPFAGDLSEALASGGSDRLQRLLDDDQVPLALLAEALREIRPAGSETPVYLRSDEEVPYGFVVRVMGEIKEGGVDDLSLVVEPEARGGS